MYIASFITHRSKSRIAYAYGWSFRFSYTPLDLS